MLDLTDEAIQYSIKKVEETGNSDIRVGLQGGGCNGFEYIIKWAIF